MTDKKFLTVKEFSDRLESVGIRVSEQTVRTWIREGKLQGHRPGVRQWYVLESEVDRLINEGLEGDHLKASKEDAINNKAPLLQAA